MYKGGAGQVRYKGEGRDLVLPQGDGERCIAIVFFCSVLSFAIKVSEEKKVDCLFLCLR